MLKAISPIDGRYEPKTKILQHYFSEYALIKYRLDVEIRYLKALRKAGIPQLSNFSNNDILILEDLVTHFNLDEAKAIKEIESVTNHDVKAVEYYIKEKIEKFNIKDAKEFVHFGLTSQDINNTAFPMMIRDAIKDVIIPEISDVLGVINEKAEEYRGIPMLARTHGQPASPTTLGKEFGVFVERLEKQIVQLKDTRFYAKFGGATGNFNAHKVSYPDIHWPGFGDQFVEESLGLKRQQKTTQIEHYDGLSELFDNLTRICTILIDLCRDLWTYISMEYFGQKVIKGEIGSSAMPHKVNPIDFENAEGNLGLAIALFHHLSIKLPISRLQRDLTDSTVLRNIGVPMAHFLIACKSIQKGMTKILLRPDNLEKDLDHNWAVLAEAIQNILRRENYPNPYEALLELTRGKPVVTKQDLHNFIDSLNISHDIKTEMKKLTPSTYTGYN